jgi:hypothetical protein
VTTFVFFTPEFERSIGHACAFLSIDDRFFSACGIFSIFTTIRRRNQGISRHERHFRNILSFIVDQLSVSMVLQPKACFPLRPNTAEKRLRMHQIMKIWRGI